MVNEIILCYKFHVWTVGLVLNKITICKFVAFHKCDVIQATAEFSRPMIVATSRAVSVLWQERYELFEPSGWLGGCGTLPVQDQGTMMLQRCSVRSISCENLSSPICYSLSLSLYFTLSSCFSSLSLFLLCIFTCLFLSSSLLLQLSTIAHSL